MFDKFEEYFEINSSENKYYTVNKFLECYRGQSVGNGLYRFFTINESNIWKKNIGEAYPDFKNNFEVFAYDWLGRCFAIDKRVQSEHNGQVLLFDIGAADILEISCDFQKFHENEIPIYGESCLAISFYKEWLSANKPLEQGKCAGYKVPLFLGGKDTIDNLEISDMEVYWYILTSVKNR